MIVFARFIFLLAFIFGVMKSYSDDNSAHALSTMAVLTVSAASFLASFWVR